MIAYKDVGDIVKLAVGVEKKLSDFYDVARIAVRNESSRSAIDALKSRLAEKLAVLEKLKPEKYGSLEWIQYAPELKEEDVVPKGRITRDSSAMEIFSHILVSEQKLSDFYKRLSGQLVARAQKELFESLVTFKSGQIEEIRNLMRDAQP